MLNSIRVKLCILLSGIILFTVVSSTVVLNWFVQEPLMGNALDSLKNTSRIIDQVLDERKRRMVNNARLIGELPILATVLEEGDRNTVLDSSRRYQKELNLDILDVYDDEGSSVCSAESETGNPIFNDSHIIDIVEPRIEGDDVGSTFTIRNEQLAMIASAPIGIVDEPTGVLVTGMYLDNNFARQIRTLSRTDISFVVSGVIRGSSLNEEDKDRIIEVLEKDSEVSSDRIHSYKAAEYLYYIVPIKDLNESILGSLIIEYSLYDVNQVLEGIKKLLSLIGLSIFVIAIAIGYVSTNITVIRPILKLKGYANELQKGNLDVVIETGRKDELGVLADSFSEMKSSLKHYIMNLKDLNQALDRFVPNNFLNLLQKTSIIDIKLGDSTKQNLSILFSDIRSFTTITENNSSEDIFIHLNAYLERMTPIISSHKGFIDKYIGDAIMALFPVDADDSLISAIEMQKCLQEWNGTKDEKSDFHFEIGVGINYGDVMLGTLGSADRMEGTVISDSVNMASRIEGLTKQYSAKILITDSLVKALKNPYGFNIRLVDHVKVKGKAEKVAIYEEFSADTPEIIKRKSMSKVYFEEACLHYESKRFLEARDGFAFVIEKFGEDHIAAKHLKQCDYTVIP